jgi:hypothetical protein
MADNNVSNFSQLEQYFEDKVLSIAQDMGYKTMVWEDVFINGVRPAAETVITSKHCTRKAVINNLESEGNLLTRLVWHLLDYTTLLSVVEAGYSACVNSNWYLNRPYITYTWADLYIRELNDGQIPQNLSSLIIGGEASTWGEWVDHNNIIPVSF